MTENISSVPEEADRQPAADRDSYYCPHARCGTFAFQASGDVLFQFPKKGAAKENNWIVHRCQACNRVSLWLFEPVADWGPAGGHRLVYPLRSVGLAANKDMPEAALAVYEEAQRVAPLSARSAAALLRLTLQIVIDGLVPGSKSINDKIGTLVEQGLHPQIQQSMDVLRVVGNNAVHPGQIDLEEDPSLVDGLFILVNLVVDQMISRPKHAQALYDALPQKAHEQIARRDGTAA